MAKGESRGDDSLESLLKSYDLSKLTADDIKAIGSVHIRSVLARIFDDTPENLDGALHQNYNAHGNYGAHANHYNVALYLEDDQRTQK